jgi:hypothetical protein
LKLWIYSLMPPEMWFRGVTWHLGHVYCSDAYSIEECASAVSLSSFNGDPAVPWQQGILFCVVIDIVWGWSNGALTARNMISRCNWHRLTVIKRCFDSKEYDSALSLDIMGFGLLCHTACRYCCTLLFFIIDIVKAVHCSVIWHFIDMIDSDSALSLRFFAYPRIEIKPSWKILPENTYEETKFWGKILLWKTNKNSPYSTY